MTIRAVTSAFAVAFVSFVLGLWCGRERGSSGQTLDTVAIVAAPPRANKPSPIRVGENPNLSCDVKEVGAGGSIVQVSWSGMGFQRKTDWIGMFPHSQDLRQLSTPIKYRYVLPEHAMEEGYPSPNGTMSFDLENMRVDVVFAYISGNMQYPSLVAISEPVVMLQKAVPHGLHIALGNIHGSMHVYWQAGVEAKNQVVKFGRTCDQLDVIVEGKADPARQFSALDMCDVDQQPAGRQGWFDPGRLFEARLTELDAAVSYCYIVGSDEGGWTDTRIFKAPRRLGWDDDRPLVITAFGDLGQVEKDKSFHHSWDFGNRGEIPSMNTTESLRLRETDAELVLHIGDISYAVGYISEWVNFFRQVEAVASTRPWMTAIGNHEQGYSGSFTPGTDSGGECGVPYNAYFPFASQSSASSVSLKDRKPWYAFKYGPVAFIQMSTEHNFTRGSEQHRWLESALAGVNRSETPWLIFSGHRPMVVASDFEGDRDEAALLQIAVEPMLLEYKVDLALWAHFHAFAKFCPLLNNTCTQDGIRHLIIGMAGYDHSPCSKKGIATLTVCDDQHWGYMRMTFDRNVGLTIQYVNAASGEILDEFTLPESRAALFTGSKPLHQLEHETVV